MHTVYRALTFFLFLIFYFILLLCFVESVSSIVDLVLAPYLTQYFQFIAGLEDYNKVIVDAYSSIFLNVFIYAPFTILFLKYAWVSTKDGAPVKLLIQSLLLKSLFLSLFLSTFTITTFILSCRLFFLISDATGFNFVNYHFLIELTLSLVLTCLVNIGPLRFCLKKLMSFALRLVVHTVRTFC